MNLYSRAVDLSFWQLNLRVEGRKRQWQQIGSNYQPPYYVERYSAHVETKSHTDPYFSVFLQDRYNHYDAQTLERMKRVLPSIVEKDIYKVHFKWRWGNPGRESAVRNLIRFTTPINDPDFNVWSMCEEWAGKHFSFMQGSKICWDFDYCSESLNQQSSPGFPYSRGAFGRKPFAKKCDYFECEGGDFARKNFADYLERISNSDYVPTSWYTCTVKKELRKVKKMEADDYRAYLAANVDNSMAGNGATLDMNNKFYSSWATSASFVGGSIFNSAWNILFQRLNKHKFAFEMDVSAWDSTLSEYMIMSLSRVMWGFVRQSDRTPLNRIRWDNLFKEIFMSLVICPNGDVFFKLQGNPSGSFLTIVTNTIIHYMLFCYAWLRLSPEKTTYREFSEFVELALCGDDSLFTVAESVVSWFNMENIAEVWKSLGIKVKVEATGKGPLVERNFLSQATTMCGGCYVPYPDYDKAVSSMLWHTRAHTHIRWSYLKACALRMSTFFNGACRELFSDYIQYLQITWGSALRVRSKRTKEDPFTFEEVNTVWKSDDQLYQLYMTLEAEQPRVSNKSVLKSVAEKLNEFSYEERFERWSEDHE